MVCWGIERGFSYLNVDNKAERDIFKTDLGLLDPRVVVKVNDSILLYSGQAWV